jgi:hypothetical protein
MKTVDCGLWIDAVCIDQDDEREKSSQVRHMHTVYSRAEEVGIYFGECVELSDHKSVVERIYIAEQTRRHDIGREIHVAEFVRALEDCLLGDLACGASLQHFWWKRLWTVQELLLAKHPVVYCGPYVLLWGTVCYIWTKLDVLDGFPQPSPKMRIDILYLNALRCQAAPNLHALLVATTDKAFTDPKDRIFALLGALSQPTLSLDYALDSRVINALTAIHCVTTQGSFDIFFSQWERSYQLDSELGTPRLQSCVPNFGQSHDTRDLDWNTPCLKRLEQGRWEGARVSTVPDLLNYGNPERNQSLSILSGRDISIEVIENTASRCRLTFNGTRVTTVSKLYRLGQHKFDWIMADLSRSNSQYIAKTLCKGTSHWNVTTTDRREQRAYDLYTLLLESCSLHLEGDGGRAIDFKFEAQRQREDSWLIRKTVHGPKECLEFLEVLDECLRRPWSECLAGPLASRRWDWTANTYSPNQMGEVHEVLQILLHAVLKVKSWSGSFFITSDGHLGIGPKSTQPGDQIVVLDGARSPFVLRALEHSSDYALLGDSFVLGLMHGEVREMDARGELEPRKFVIQ